MTGTPLRAGVSASDLAAEAPSGQQPISDVFAETKAVSWLSLLCDTGVRSAQMLPGPQQAVSIRQSTVAGTVPCKHQCKAVHL